MRWPAAFLIAVVIIILQCQQVFAPVEDFYAPSTSFGGDWTNNPGNATGEPDNIVAWDMLDSNTELFTYGFENLPMSGQINKIFIGIRSNFSAPGSGDDELTLKYSVDTFSWSNLDGSSYSGANLTNQSSALNSEYYPLSISLTWLEIAGMYLGAEGKTTGSPDSEIAGIDSIWLRVDYSDIEPPLISLMSPSNNNLSLTGDIIFRYNVTDTLSEIKNCSLILDGKINLTNSSVLKGIEQRMVVYSLNEGNYNWSVNCTDNSSNYNTNSSQTRNITIDTSGPIILLENPLPGTEWNTTPTIIFEYNVSDFMADVAICYLIIDGQINGSAMSSVQEDTTLTFERQIENGNHNWSVNCTDSNGIMANSSRFNLDVDVHRPEILDVAIPDLANLVVASTAQIICNATVSHQKGIGLISNVDGIIYDTSFASSTPDNPNYHYSNTSCTQVSSEGNSANYTCSFWVYYHANPGGWGCNITAEDINGLEGSKEENFSINELYGVSIYPNYINYSALKVGENSINDVNISITNFGNTEIDIALYGYGYVQQDGLAMNCSIGNISVEFEKYSESPNLPYTQMVSLTSIATQLDTFNLAKQTSEASNSSKTLHWKMGVPLGVSGNCTGNVVIGVVPT